MIVYKLNNYGFIYLRCCNLIHTWKIEQCMSNNDSLWVQLFFRYYVDHFTDWFIRPFLIRTRTNTDDNSRVYANSLRTLFIIINICTSDTINIIIKNTYVIVLSRHYYIRYRNKMIVYKLYFSYYLLFIIYYL